MKKPILLWASTLLLILFGFINQAQAQCSGSNACFDFQLVSATSVSSTMTRLTFSIKTNCDKDLSYAAFELPAGVKASNATAQKYKYSLENTTNNPFYSVKFEGNGINGYKNGVQDVFSFDVSTAAYSKMTSLRVQAKAGQNVGTVTFNPKDCSTAGDDGDDDNGDGDGNQPCNTSQPRPIVGKTNPCPGEIVTYCIENDRNYTSFEWDVPRAQAGEPPIGWEIISGQGTNCVTVRVGQKNGTMKVKVTDPVCGTKVATLPVKPGDDLTVSIKGDTKFCAGDVLVFEAKAGKGNKKSYDYFWTVPTGWTVVSGQGTGLLIVKAGASAGNVSVVVASNQNKNKAICASGEASVPVTQKPNCSPCAKPDLDVDAPEVVCASGDKIYKFGVENPDPNGKVKYQFFLPEEFQIVSQGYGYVNIKVNNAKPDSTLFVTVVAVNANNCGADAVCLPVQVEDCQTGPCDKPVVALVAPDTVCNLADEPTTISVADMQEGVTYAFDVPEGFFILDEGPGYVTVVAIMEEEQLGQPYTFRVTATNECASVVAEKAIVVADCGAGNPLPVTLVGFNGASSNGAIELNWVTATEINNDRFEIERSTDGKNFLKVGEVKGKGNSSVMVKYSFTDQPNSAGTVYYRLKQVDYDNSFEYSKVIAVKSSATARAAASMSVYPNPVTDGNVNIRFQDQVAGSATIRLVDLNGRVLHTKELSNLDTEVAMNLSSLNLRAGIYLLSVTANGQNTTHRIVVQ